MNAIPRIHQRSNIHLIKVRERHHEMFVIQEEQSDSSNDAASSSTQKEGTISESSIHSFFFIRMLFFGLSLKIS